ncbi:MAG: glycosyltransferase [Nanoarchaeota archaeon]
MNILILSEYFPESGGAEITGGVENRVFYLAKELSKKNKVFVITSRRPNKIKVFFSGIDVINLGPAYPYTSSGHVLKRALWGMNTLLKLPGIILKNKIDVVDGQSFFCYPAAIFSKLFGVKAHITYHEVWLNSWVKNTGSWMGIFGELMERKVLLLSRLLKIKVISVSDATSKKLFRHKVTSVVVPNGVNVGYYKKIKAKKTKEPSICFVGRLVPHKKVDVLLHAVARIKKEIPKLKCVIIGDGPDKKRLMKLAEDLNIKKNVEFLGYVESYDSVIRALKSSWILCHPGTVEGFGIVLLESMASNVPYVASDIGVFKEVTDNGKGGLLFKTNDEKDLAKKAAKLLKDKKLYGEKVKETVFVKKYDWEKVAKELKKVYSE